MRPTFQQTLNVLVRAYLNDTLEHHKCNACAVTNIIGSPHWSRLFITIQSPTRDYIHQYVANKNEVLITNCITGASKMKRNVASKLALFQLRQGKAAIKNSGYTMKELARIEYAFESSDKGESKDEYMFNGLMAVVDVLADIHNIDLSVREDAKLLFVKV